MRRLIAVLLCSLGIAHGAEWVKGDLPVWLLGNDFHTSMVFRLQDVPFGDEITGARDADYLAIGWGASADYRGPSTPWTVLQAIFPNRGALHVVPIRGSILRRFPRCDVVVLGLTRANFSKLMDEIDWSFALTRDHHRIFLEKGYFSDSRFYASSERFYFPYVCNEWVAVKLGRAGMPFFLPRALLSNSLILQAGEKGITLQRHNGRQPAY